jgi:site-specific DNA-methyltransferase (adenine-specific)
MKFENEIIEGDCTAILKSLPDSAFHLALTDPPYLVGYRDRAGRTIRNDDDPAGVLPCFPELYRVLRPDSLCVCFYGWNRIDLFFRAWTQAGFRPVGHFVWCKEYASRTGLVKACHEQAYLLAKGRPAIPAEPLEDVQPWEYSGNRCHPTEKAVSILAPLIESFSPLGGLVIDPFAGSGSTAVAAALSGRRYCGIELEARYCAVARRRLAGVARYREHREAA